MKKGKIYTVMIAKIVVSAAAILIVAGTFSACKKTDDSINNNLQCAISTVTTSSGEVYHFLYNDDGKLLFLTFNNRTSTFSYSGNTRIITTFDAGFFFPNQLPHLMLQAWRLL